MRIASPASREKRWIRYLPWLTLSAAAVLGAAWATWLNIHSAMAAQAPPTPAPTAIVKAAEPVELPPFQANPETTALVRRADLQTLIPNRPTMRVRHYTVQAGDSVFGVAEKFNLKPETILWGNYEVLNDDPHLLRPGQELNILPVDGVYYQWHEGDSIQRVADTFKADAGEILDWPGNNLNPLEPEVADGAWLVIPGGRREFRQWLVPTIARGNTGTGAAIGPGACSGEYSGAVGTGGFIWPTENHTLSGNDYWSGHLAIDIAAGEGAPVWAADSGVVVFAGWANGGYGNTVVIDHGNGWQTLYAHLSVVRVGCGSSVQQGGGIGAAGSTGNSTGAHLHFETRNQGGFVNPWFVLP
jgi:murein DD-endopeptidase MepM/ murein hydrolase activator NlpD